MKNDRCMCKGCVISRDPRQGYQPCRNKQSWTWLIDSNGNSVRSDELPDRPGPPHPRDATVRSAQTLKDEAFYEKSINTIRGCFKGG